jgi:hypothetical protein
MATPIQPTTARALGQLLAKATASHAQIAVAAQTAAEQLSGSPGGPEPSSGPSGQQGQQGRA